MNILDPILRQMRAYPDRPAVVDQGQTISYARLWRKSGIVASHLQGHGVQAGQCVAVSGLSLQSHLVALMALARLGAVSTYLQYGMADEARREILARNKVVAWIGEQGSGGIPGMKMIAPADLARPLAEGAVLPRLVTGVQDKVWRIALSSGTTGVSKSIPFTHAQGALLQRLSLDAYPTGPGERLLVLADLGIGFALAHCMRTLAGGGTVIFPGAFLGPEIVGILERDAPTQILSTPAIATGLLGYIARLPGDKVPKPGSLLSVTLGGSIVTPALRSEVERLLCRNLVVIYGSTELGGTARCDLYCTLQDPGTAGRLLPWVEGEAVDDAGVALPPGQIGRLRFRSPAMVGGYLADPQATAAAFRDGWYYPGDKGSIDAGRNLRLSGRVDDVINLLGIKLDPARIEAAVNSHPSVTECAVTVTPQAARPPILTLLVVAADEESPAREADLKALVREKVGTLHEPSRVQMVAALPRTGAGKLAREQLPAMVQLPVAPAANEGQA